MTKARAQLARNKVIVISYVVALALFGISALVIPGFGAGNHMTVLLRQLSILTILAMGQTFVTISGGNDLSIPWMMNSAAVLLTFLGKGSNESMIWLIPVVLLICAAFGALNGIGIAFLHIPPIIMTLGVNYVLEGALLALLQGKNGGNAPEKLIAFCNGGVLGIPNMFLVMLLVCAIGIFMLNFSTYGRKLYAVGNSKRVAFFSGINVKATLIKAYMFSGITAGIGGILLAGRLKSSYLGMGDDYLFKTLIVVVLGGTSMAGGSGSLVGTLAGAIILITLEALLSALSFSTSMQNILYGAILLLAIIFIPDKKRKKR